MRFRPDSRLVVNADDPQVGRSRDRAAGGDDVRRRRSRAGAAVAPARRRLEVLPPLRHALRIRSRLRRPSRRLPLPALRSRRVRRSTCRPARSSSRARRCVVRPRHAGGDAARQARAARALQRLQRPRRRRRSRASWARAWTRSRRARRLRDRRSGASSGSRSATGRVLLLLIKNPAGANEAVRTLVAGGAPSLAVIALNDAIADGRDVSWIWDVDFEPLLEGLERLVVTGGRAAELASAASTAGSTVAAIEVVPDLERALDRGLELTPRRRRARPSSPRTRRCSRCARIARRARQRAAVLGARRA